LALVDIITPNETEAEKLTGIRVENDDETRPKRRRHCVKDPYCTDYLRQSRCVGQRQRRRSRVPGFKVEAVDTIAAGDTFNGALVTALLEGLRCLKRFVLRMPLRLLRLPVKVHSLPFRGVKK
jgi:ribokinase